MRVFKDVGLVEQLGSGMSRILRAYDRSAFRISPNFLVVSFRYPMGLTPQVSPQDAPQDSLEDKILAYCAQPRSKKEIAAHFGYKDAKSFGERYIQPLLDDGRLVRTIPEKPTSRNHRYKTAAFGKEDGLNAE